MGIEASKQTGMIGQILVAAALTHEFTWGTATRHLLSATSLKEVSLLIWWFHQIYVDQQTCKFSYSKTAKSLTAWLSWIHALLPYHIQPRYFFPWFFFCAGYLISPLMLLVIEPTQTAPILGACVTLCHFCHGEGSWLHAAWVFFVEKHRGRRLLDDLSIPADVIKPGKLAITGSQFHQRSAVSESGILGSFFTYLSSLSSHHGTRANCLRRFHVLTGEEILRKLSQYPESLELGAESLSGALLWQWGFTNHWAHKS